MAGGGDASGRLERLDEAITVLASGGVYLSREELLDALWLAGRLPERDPAGAPLERAATHDGAPLPDMLPAAPAVPAAVTPVERPARPTAPPPPPKREAHPRPTPVHQAKAPDRRPADRTPPGLYGGGHTPHDRPGGADAEPPDTRRGLPLRVPEDKALHQELSIGRALRPLKQHRPNPLKREFDEVATAAALAETGLPDVVTRPARERWLDLALVVDDGTSMLLWRRLAVELRTVLQRSGAFRVVRVLGLHTRGGDAPALRTRPYDPAAPHLPTSALVDPSGHTLVLVVSDGVGAAWRDGRMGEVLARWAGVGPTAVVHALPPRLWDSSGIRSRRWQVRTRRPGSANADWAVADPVLPAALARFDGVPVPVLEPEAGPLADWARLIASASGTAVLPLLAPTAARPASSSAPSPSPSAADELGRVQLFRDAASPEAYRLAAHLSAVAPLPVPVMRMVQKAVDGRSDTGRLAEVFLGGLMRPVEPPASAGPDPLPPEHRPFAFTDAAQRALLGAVPLAELVATCRTIGRRLEELAGRSPDFPAWLAHAAGPDHLPPAARPFSTVERRLAARLGAPSQSSAFATRTAAQPWRRLGPGDPHTIGPYRLTMAGPPGARLTPYLGQDAYGAEAVVQSTPSEGGRTDTALRVCAEALRRMDGRYARRLVREGLDDEVPWIAEEPLIGERLDHILRTAPERWNGHAALALARKIADAVRRCADAGLVHGNLSISAVEVAGEDILLTDWSSAAVDGVMVPGFLIAPTPEDDVSALGDILLCLGGGAQTARPGPGLYFMPRWSSAAWEPLRALVMSCRERPERHTVRQVWEFLRDFRPEAAEAPMAVLAADDPRPEPDGGLPSFEEFDSYRRLGGSGGYDVYLARAARRSRDVVIRTAPGAHRELRAEVEALRRMSGHYAPRLIASACNLAPPWIATEFVTLPDGSPAPTLASFLGRGAPQLDPVHAATIGLRLAEAVNMCALKGIVLRKLTADSVLIGRTVKLTCWTGAAIDDVNSSHADNVYALGVILRAIADAQPTPSALADEQLWRDPQLLSVIGACLSGRPDRRPTAGQVAGVIVRCLPSVSAATMPYDVQSTDTQIPHDTPDMPAPAPQPRPRRLTSRFRFSAKSQRQRKLEPIRAPLTTSHRIAVISRPVGVGRTAATLALGAIFAGERQDGVIAVDTIPGGYGLTRRVEHETPLTIRDLAQNPRLDGRPEQFTTRKPSGLEILAADPDLVAPVTDGEYSRVIEALSSRYSIILSDADTDAVHTSMRNVLDLADQLIIVTSPSVERMSSAHPTLNRLAEEGHADLVRQAITVVSTSHATGAGPSDDLVEGFRARCRGVVVVPYDDHVAALGDIDLNRLAPRTLDAYIDLAALVAEGFPGAGE